MSASKTVVKNTAILYARMLLTVFLSLYTTRILVSSLGKGDFGIFNLVAGATIMLNFVNESMAAASQRFISYSLGAKEFQKQKTVFNISVILHISAALIALIVLEGGGWFLFKSAFKIDAQRIDEAKLVYQFAIVTAIFTIIAVPYDATMTAHENMTAFAILGVVEAVFKFGCAYYTISTKFDKLLAFSILSTTLTIGLTISKVIYCHLRYPECTIAPRKYFSSKIFHEMRSFAGWSLLGTSSGMLSNYGQGIVINSFFGTIINAAQGVALQVSGQLGAFARTMMRAVNPLIAKSEGAGDRQAMLRASVLGTKFSFFLLAAFYIPFLIEMPYVFRIWLRDPPDFAVIFCQLVLLRNLVEQLTVTFISSISAVGNIRGYQIISSILNFFPLLFGYLLLKRGLPAYAIHVSFLIYSFFSSGVIIYYTKRHCGLSLSFFMRDIAGRAIIVSILTFAIGSLPSVLISESLSRALVTFAASVTSLIFFGARIGFSSPDRSEIANFAKNAIQKFSEKVIKRDSNVPST